MKGISVLLVTALVAAAVATQQCPAENGEVDTLLVHEDCSKFYKCDGGVPVQQDCPLGLFFQPTSETQGYCDWPYNVNCDRNNGGGNQGGGNQGGGNQGGGNQGGGNQGGGNQGGGNQGGGGSGEKCECKCDGGSDSGDKEYDNGCPSDYNVHKLLPHEDNENWFYYCENGNRFPSQCAPGLVFVADNQICDWP